MPIMRTLRTIIHRTVDLIFGVRFGNALHDRSRLLIAHAHLQLLALRARRFCRSARAGLSTATREPLIIVSLTSFPERVCMPTVLPILLYSLLNQTLKPDKVILWLAVSDFPGKEDDLPEQILAFTRQGLSIGWTADLRSFTKLIPSLKAYPDAIIVTADDDMFYPRDWLQKLYNTSIRHPGTAVSCCPLRIAATTSKVHDYGEWHTSGFTPNSVLTFPRGVGGVLYPPGIFHHDVFDTQLFMALTPSNDDIWFWAMVVLNGGRFNAVPNGYAHIIDCIPDKTHQTHLRNENREASGNNLFLKRLFDHYPEVRKAVFDEAATDVDIDMSERIIPDESCSSKERYLLYLRSLFAYEFASGYIKSPARVLEVGYGDGYGTVYLARKLPMCQFCAIDLAASLSDISTNKYRLDNCHFVSYDGNRIPYEDRAFDVIVSFQVIEHVADVDAYLHEMIRVLKPDGRIIISTPNRSHRLAEGQTPWNRYHLREFSAQQLKFVLESRFRHVDLYSTQASREILRAEYARVGLARSDLSSAQRFCIRMGLLIRKQLERGSSDYSKKYSLKSFYNSDQDIERGMDLVAISARPRMPAETELPGNVPIARSGDVQSRDGAS